MGCYAPLPGTKIAERRRATEMVGETSPTIKPAPEDQRAPLEETWSAERTEEKEEGMEIDPPSIQAKE
jgi:hypothetical protein